MPAGSAARQKSDFPLGCDEDAASCDCSWHENARRAQETHPLETAEDVLEAIDAWIDDGDSREFKVRKTLLGSVATLFDRGKAVAVGRGRGSVNALANALENL